MNMIFALADAPARHDDTIYFADACALATSGRRSRADRRRGASRRADGHARRHTKDAAGAANICGTAAAGSHTPPAWRKIARRHINRFAHRPRWLQAGGIVAR